MILCDIGNTTFEFFNSSNSLYFNNKQKLKLSINSKKAFFPKFNEKVYFLSVNKKATKKLLKLYPDAINCKHMINFKTKYIGMGIDRQMACSGILNAIVVDCGSAITVDVMKNAKHKGGFILSGIQNLINLYPNISPKLKFNFDNNINLDKIPLNTNTAINYAVLKSIILPIKEIQNRYNLKIIFTGEDSKYIIDLFENKKYKQNLVFNNLYKIIKIKRQKRK